MKHIFVLVSLCASLWASGQVARADEPFDAAARAYERGEHAAAAAGFEQAIAQHGYSAPLLYNLGLAQLASERPAAAIASFERARLLAPRDARIAKGLDLARTRLGLTPPSLPESAQAAAMLSPREWTWLGASGVVLVALGLFSLGWTARRRRWSGAAIATGLLVAALSTSALWIAWFPLSGAVVREDGAVGRKSPFPKAEPRFSLPEGDLVTVQKRHAGYAYVRTRHGDQAWVADEALEPLVLETSQPAPKTPDAS